MRDQTPPAHRDAPPAGAELFDCHAAVSRLWDYLDGELGEADARAVDAHLAECDRCPPHFAFERQFLAAVRRVRAAPAERGGRLRDRVVAALAAEGFALP
jgi:anti-sigma factor (TIGR02949 family)